LKQSLALLLAALWVPVALHCSLEALPTLDLFDCCSSPENPSAASKCSTSVCCSVEAGFVKSEEDDRLTSGVWSSPAPFVRVEPIAASAPAERLVARAVATAPPELRAGWPFHHRAALSPRAPNFAS
jgi:hypothetical protein